MRFFAYNQTIESDFDLKLPPSQASRADITIKKGVVFEIKTHLTKINRKGITAKIAIKDKSIILEWEQIAKFSLIDNDTILYQYSDYDYETLRLFAVSEALGLSLFKKGFFLLHGSAVLVKNSAVVIVGEPGFGKSTTIAAFAKQGFTVLSDDMTAINFDGQGQPYVIPAYPEIKIWEDTAINLGFNTTKLEPTYEGNNKFLYRPNDTDFPVNPIKLSKIIILKRPHSKAHNGIINPIESPIELLKYFPLPHQLLRSTEAKKHFEDSLRIGQSTIVEKILRPKNFKQLLKFVDTFK